MKKGLILILIIFLISMSLVNFVEGIEQNLTASISNPRMVLYKNTTKGEILEFQNSVIVNNVNDYDVMIKINPSGAWKNRVTIEENEFVMKPDERKEVFYDVKIEKAGYYQSYILVTFIKEGLKNSLVVAQELVVIVSDESGKVPEEITGSVVASNKNLNKNELGLIVGLIFAIIIILFLIIILNKRRILNRRRK